MLTGYAFPTNNSKQVRNQDPHPSGAVSRLLAAAVINKGFCDLLLTDPPQALAQGYQGEIFPLDSNEKNLVLSIQADNLSDFALQIISYPKDRTRGFSGSWIPLNQKALVLGAE